VTTTDDRAGAVAADVEQPDDLLGLAERIVALARPGEQVEVFVARSRSTSVKAYGGEVEALTSAASAGVGIRVIDDHRQGFAHAGTLDEAVIAEVLDDARDNAGFGEQDEWLGLAEPDGVAAVRQDLWRDAVVAFPTEQKVEIALALERAVKGIDRRVTGVRAAAYGDSQGEAAIASTTGMRQSWRATYCSASVSAIAVDGDETKTGAGVDNGRDPSELDLDRVAADAVDRATRLFGAKPVASQRLTVVFEPRLAATIIGLTGGTLSGERVLKGRSPFADRLGDAIAAECVVLVDDPTNPLSMGADEFDGEGLACRRNVLVDGGVLRGFLHDAYTGRRAGVPSTASAVRGYRSTPTPGAQALAVAPGTRSFDDIVASIDHGFLVQDLSGLHSGVNAVSGDFSVGAEGLMIRGGAIAEPVREVTLASTLQRLLLDIREVGADLEWRPGGTGAATLVIDDVSLSGS
jgi:PmbA protein